LADEAIIFAGDTDPSHVGGSYCYLGRWAHDLNLFQSFNQEEKNQVFGRDLSQEKPHEGFDKRLENPRLENPSPGSHTKRAHGSMYRQAYPYQFSTGEKGLLFSAYSRTQIDLERALERMVGAEDGIVDNLFKFTKNVYSNYFYVPSLVELEHLDSNETKNKQDLEKTQHLPTQFDPCQISFEWCTNCGFKSIFLERKKAIERIGASLEIVENKDLPRLTSFEVEITNLKTGQKEVLWSKLTVEGGNNNYSTSFPSNAFLVEKIQTFLGIQYFEEQKQLLEEIKQQRSTIGVWDVSN